jgi:predicted peroxiredoxin/TusA-related sulfurtransferase
MTTVTADRTLERRGRSITTFVVYDATVALRDMPEGAVLEIITDDFEPFRSDIATWAEEAGHRLIDVRTEGGALSSFVEKGSAPSKDTKLAMVISADGLEELLSPLGFALGAALEGINVSLYFQGPAVRVLTRGFQPKLKGWGRPFSRFAAAGMTKSGHIPAQEKLAQIRDLGGHLYVCGGSLQPFKVDPGDFVFDDLEIVEYLTFVAVMEKADIQLYL